MDRFRYLLSLLLIASVGYSAPIDPKTTVADKKPHESILCNNESCGNVLFSSTSKPFKNSSSLPIVPLPAIPPKEIMNSTKFRIREKLLNFNESPDFAIQHNYDDNDFNIAFDEGNNGNHDSMNEYDGKNNIEHNTAFDDDAEEDITPEDDAEQDSTPEDGTEQNTAFDDDAEEDATPEDDVEQDGTPEDGTEHNTDFDDDGEQDSTPEDATEHNTAFDDDADEDATPEDDVEQGSTPEDDTEQNTAFDDEAEQDATPVDDAEQDATPEDSAEQNTAFVKG